jgi:hypothetical protein
LPSKTEKEITHQQKTPGIKKEADSFMHCHKILLEALERLLFEEFCFSLGEERPMMGLPDDSFELLKTLVDEPIKRY